MKNKLLLTIGIIALVLLVGCNYELRRFAIYDCKIFSDGSGVKCELISPRGSGTVRIQEKYNLMQTIECVDETPINCIELIQHNCNFQQKDIHSDYVFSCSPR